MENATAPSIIRDLPNKLYHEHPAVSSTTLKKFMPPNTPAHAKHAIDNPKKATEALIRGQVLHCLLLEEHRLDIDFVIEKEKLWDKTKLVKNGGSKEKWELLKAEADQRLVSLVPNKLWVEAQAMRDSIEAHPYWQNVKKFGQKELTIIGQLKGEPVRVRYDAQYGSIVLDVKSSRFPLTDARIQAVIAEELYHLSAAMYLEVGQSVGMGVDRFVWIFVQNVAPYCCRFIEATEKMLEVGRDEFYKCLSIYTECKNAGEYPGYPVETEIKKVDLPDWYAKREFMLINDSDEDDNESDS